MCPCNGCPLTLAINVGENRKGNHESVATGNGAYKTHNEDKQHKN